MKLSKQDQDWLKKHEHELPQTTDGERINYDPVICFDPSEAWRFKALQLLRKNREMDHFLPPNSEQRTIHVAFLFKLLQTKMTVMQVLCLYGMVQGKTQGQLAQIFKVKQQAISKHQENAFRSLTTHSKP